MASYPSVDDLMDAARFGYVTVIEEALNMESASTSPAGSKRHLFSDINIQVKINMIQLAAENAHPEFIRVVLYYAVRNSFHDIAVYIVTSLDTYFASDIVRSILVWEEGWTILHLVSTSSREVCRILLNKYPELLEQNDNVQKHTVLHKWAYENQLWPLEMLVNWKLSCVLDMICKQDVDDDNPFHAAISENIQYARNLNDAFDRAIAERMEACGTDITESEEYSPWTQRNASGYTPFHFALSDERFKKEEDLLIKVMSNNVSLCYIHNSIDKSLLGIAVIEGFHEITNYILDIQDQEELFGMPLMENGDTVLHHLSPPTSVETAKLLLQKFWWIMDEVDSKGNTPMDILVSNKLASSGPLSWFLKRLKRNPNSVKRTFFNLNTLMLASERGQMSVLLPYINHCSDHVQICRDAKDTPLHHIKLENPGEYEKFLANAKIKQMMNICDSAGATPLHKAIERKEKALVEALLSHDGVNKSIEDNNGETAIELLRKQAKDDEDWAEICTRIIGIDPRIKTRFIEYPSKKNLEDIRTTLSVIAALLATLTFAAGFTVPGGFKSDGSAVLSKDPRFLAFLLADAFAMCCSMLVLFFLMWSMMCKSNIAVQLIDNSVLFLVLALYGSLVAFITGVYSITFRMTLWVAIVVIVLCSSVGLIANTTKFAEGYYNLGHAWKCITRSDPEQGVPATEQGGVPLDVAIQV